MHGIAIMSVPPAAPEYKSRFSARLNYAFKIILRLRAGRLGTPVQNKAETGLESRRFCFSGFILQVHSFDFISAGKRLGPIRPHAFGWYARPSAGDSAVLYRQPERHLIYWNSDEKAGWRNEAGFSADFKGRYGETRLGPVRLCLCNRGCLCGPSFLWTCHHFPCAGKRGLSGGNHLPAGLEAPGEHSGAGRAPARLPCDRREYGFNGKPLYRLQAAQAVPTPLPRAA